MSVNISFDILSYFGLVFMGMLGAIIGTAIAFVLTLPAKQQWKPILILAYACTTGLALSFIVSLLAAGLWLALAPTVGVAFWGTVCTTGLLRLIVSLASNP